MKERIKLTDEQAKAFDDIFRYGQIQTWIFCGCVKKGIILGDYVIEDSEGVADALYYENFMKEKK